MKRRLKTRKVHFCYACSRPIPPSLAIAERHFTKVDEGGPAYIAGVTLYYHPRCVYREQRSMERFNRFAQSCTHPESFRDDEYSYIPGEAVMQIERTVCRLCGRTV